jgi:hypothetical protein
MATTHHRPDQGHDHPRWRKPLSQGNRDFIYTHPAVKDVQVVGVPDATYGEEVLAVVIRKEGQNLSEDDIKALRPQPHGQAQNPPLRPLRRQLPHDRQRQIQKFKSANGDRRAGLAECSCDRDGVKGGILGLLKK